MKRIFLFLLVLVAFSCDKDEPVVIDEKCNCVVNEYAVNDVQTILINSRPVTIDCKLDGEVFGELFDNNGNVVAYKKYICPTNQ